MDRVIYLYVAFVILSAGLAGIAVWSPRALRDKVAAIVLAALVIPTAYAGLVELLGRPKPASLEWLKGASAEATVVAAEMREGEAIYLWLALDGAPEPRAYALPWDMEMAKQLQRAGREAEARGARLRMRKPFAASLDSDEPVFYPEPQPALPPKRPLTAG